MAESHTRKIAVVAGGSAGVGRAVVAHLIDAGYRVGVLARGEQRLAELVETYGDRVATITCDVADADAVCAAAARIERVLGPIDVWVNAAMATSFSPFHRMQPEEFNTIVATTLMGVVNGTRAALARMDGRNRGRIVNVGSGLSYRSVPFQSAYCASKHAINGFTSAVRSELIRSNSAVTLSLVQLPALNTPQFDWALNRLSKKPRPAAPVYHPDVAARAVMRAIAEGKREYFVGRSVIKLFLANVLFPDWLDRKLADSGVDMQKSDRPEPGGRPNNLASPVHGFGATPNGSFGAEASKDGIIVDADRLRLFGFAVLPAVALLLGLILG